MTPGREMKQQTYIRVCQDSGFKLPSTTAAQLAAGVLNIHPLEIMGALGFDAMQQIAEGTHPILKKAR
ncbi:hypothetical protein RPALISO_132 [Ruegeria phage RpAliso]|nr:hypothetical protein RPALISO_132 [Ruegeria phage RpAliso]